MTGSSESSAQQNHVENSLHGHHINTSDSLPSQASSINVVKIAPNQSVAKTMIDIPGHVQQIQMPNEDVLVLGTTMDGIISGVNIVSDSKYGRML